VVDMQNTFASKGGMCDLLGLDISGARSVIENNWKVISSARVARFKIIYLRHAYAPDLSDSAGEEEPAWHKEFGLVAMRQKPELKGKILIEGTWDTAIVDELKPQLGDIVIRKTRYGGFTGTNLDIILKTFQIKYLVFTGIATNVCVETTLREGFYLGYWPIIVSDAVNNAGPPSTQQATLWIIMYVLIGGIYSFAGPIIGTFILVLIPEFFRGLKIYAPYVSAGILIIIVYLMPQGLAGLPQLVRSWMTRRRERKAVTHPT